MSDAQRIKEWAESGWTRADVAQALGLSFQNFVVYQQSIGYKWPVANSIAHRSRERNDRSPARLEALAKARQAKIDNLTTYTVQGVTGTLRALVERFGVVTYTSVYMRLRKGWDIEKALLTPSDKRRSNWKGE